MTFYINLKYFQNKKYQDAVFDYSKSLEKETNLSEKYDVLGCLRRDLHVTVLYKQKSNSIPGEYLGRLVLGVEGEEIKVFGATIY